LRVLAYQPLSGFHPMTDKPLNLSPSAKDLLVMFERL
jgi:hypothetical protein